MKPTGIKPKVIKIIFLLSLFFLASLEPPLNLPFGFPRTTWGIMKIGLLIGIFWSLISLWLKNQKEYFIDRKSVFIFPLLFVLSIVFSLLFNFVSAEAWQFLPLFFIGVSFYFLAIIYFDQDAISPLLWLIFSLSFFSVVFGFIMLLLYHQSGFGPVVQLMISLFPSDSITAFTGDLFRWRLPSLWMIETSTSMMLYLSFFSKKTTIGFVGFLVLLAGIMLTTNRYQFVAFSFALLLFSVIFGRIIWTRYQRRLLSFIGITITVAILTIALSNALLKMNLIDRLLLRNYQRDVETLQLRSYLYSQSLLLFSRSPAIGIGWGNFGIYSDLDITYFSDPIMKLNAIIPYSSKEPHNIFFQLLAETGLLGFSTFIIMIISFAYQDWQLFYRLKGKQKIIAGVLIISFWTYLIDEQFTFLFHDSMAANVFFWFIRGILAGWFFQELKTPKKTIKKMLFVTNGKNDKGGVEVEAIRLANELRFQYITQIAFLGKGRNFKGILVFLRLYILLWRFRPDVLFSYYESLNLISGFCLLLYPFPCKLVVNEFNNPTEMMKGQSLIGFKKFLIKLVYNQTASMVIVGSKKIRTELVTHFQINHHSLIVIPCSIDIKKIISSSKGPIRQDIKPTFCYLGRLSWEKRVDLIIKAISITRKKHPSLRLLIIGTGPEFDRLKNLVQELHLEQSVSFLGWLKNPFPYLRKSRGLLLASSSEGLPHVVLEAMALQVPVITTYYPGVEELIRHRQNGFVAIDSDVHDYSRLISSVIRDKKNIRKFTTQAFSDVQQYNWSNYRQDYRDLISSL